MRRAGSALIELIAASGIILLAVFITWYGMDSYAQMRDEVDLRRSLRLAARTELARLAVGAPADSVLSDPAMQRSVQVTHTPLAEPWGALRVTTVRVSQVSRRGRTVAVELSAVLPPSGGLPR